MPTKSKYGDEFVPKRRFTYNRKPKPMEGTLVVKKPRAPISKPLDASKVRTMPLPIATDQQPPERVSVAVRGSDGALTYTSLGSADFGSIDSTNSTVTVMVRLSKLNPFVTHGPAITTGSVLAGLRASAFTSGANGIRDNTRGGTEFVIPGCSPLSVPEAARRGGKVAFFRGLPTPNPGQGSSTVQFEVGRAGFVELSVFDITGARVRTLHAGPLAPGTYSRKWDGMDDHFANAGLDLKGNLVEPVLNLSPPIAGLSIIQHKVIDPADRLFEHDLAIDHDDNRRLVFQTRRIKTQGSIGEMHLETVFAIRREIVLEPQAAVPKSERHGFPTAVRCEGIHHIVKDGVSDCLFGDHPRRFNVLFDERRLYAERRRDIVEAVDRDILRQNVLRLHINADESLYRSGILRAAHPLDPHVPSLRARGMTVQRVFEKANKGIDILLFRLIGARRRHQPSPQLADRLLPYLRMFRSLLHIRDVKSQSSCLHL